MSFLSDLSVQTWYFIGGAASLILLLSLIAIIRRNSKEKREPVIPKFEEVFKIENLHFESAPYKPDIDVIEDSILKSIALTLIIGLREFLVKVHENSSDQHKAMEAVAQNLESEGVVPIAYTQWNQSPIQGIAARVIIEGKVRTALLGPSLAMAKTTTSFAPKITEIVEGAHARGSVDLILGIDGLAYGVFEVSHSLQEILNP